jgi:hypothetical protein
MCKVNGGCLDASFTEIVWPLCHTFLILVENNDMYGLKRKHMCARSECISIGVLCVLMDFKIRFES